MKSGATNRWSTSRLGLCGSCVAAAMLATCSIGTVFAADLCSDVSAAIQHGKNGFSGIKGPPTRVAGETESTFSIAAIGGDCTIRESEASPKQLELTCWRSSQGQSCSASAEADYQKLLSEIRQCASSRMPSARVRPAQRLDRDSSSTRMVGESTRITGLGTTSDGFDLELKVGWSGITHRSTGNVRCEVDIAVGMK